MKAEKYIKKSIVKESYALELGFNSWEQLILKSTIVELEEVMDEVSIRLMEGYHGSMMGKYMNENTREDLRDRFAMSALQGEMASQDYSNDEYYTEDTNYMLADRVYGIADAMMERRKKK